MWCNNKYILEGSSESRKLVRGLLSYVNNEIKDVSNRNIVSSKGWT